MAKRCLINSSLEDFDKTVVQQ